MGTGETREGTTTPGVIGVGRVMGGSGVAEGLQELETMSGTGGCYWRPSDKLRKSEHVLAKLQFGAIAFMTLLQKSF